MCSAEATCTLLTRFNQVARLPSNLRPTTRECVHLVTHVHFRACDKDGSYTTRSTIVENLMLHANFIALSFIELELLLMEVLHCRNRDLFTFVAAVTLTLTQ